MRIVSAAVAALLFLGAGCDGHSHDPSGYATFQLCYDEHHNDEALPVLQAIVVCCLDHPVGGVAPVCGETAAECMTYLGANLAAASATSAEVTAACTEYITQKGQ